MVGDFSRWQRYKILRQNGLSPRYAKSAALENPRVDADRHALRMKLIALGYSKSSAIKFAGPKNIHIGRQLVEKSRKAGERSHQFWSPDELAQIDEAITAQDWEAVAKWAAGGVRSWVRKALSLDERDVRQHLVEVSLEAFSAGRDIKSAIKTAVDMLQSQAGSRTRTTLPMPEQRSAEGEVIRRELPAHEPEQAPSPALDPEYLLETLEDVSEQSIRRLKPDISDEVHRIILNRAMEQAKALINQGVEFDAVASAVKDIIASEVGKLQEEVPVRQNPTSYVIESTSTKFFPYKHVRGEANFPQLMGLARKVAQVHGFRTPTSLKDAVSVLDRAKYRVMEG